jgi:hypothetical protein
MADSASNTGDTRKPVSWWQTLPGVLTALAAVITAVTGLVIAVRSNDGSPRDPEPPAITAANTQAEAVPPATTAVPPATTAVPPPTTAAPVASAGAGISLPSGMDVRLAAGDVTLRILSARVEPFNREKRSLVLSVRHTNNSRYPQNFWAASYRLVIDGVPRAPTNGLNEVVQGESAKEGEVIFEVPVEAKQVVLRISAGDERTEIPFALPAGQ